MSEKKEGLTVDDSAEWQTDLLIMNTHFHAGEINSFAEQLRKIASNENGSLDDGAHMALHMFLRANGETLADMLQGKTNQTGLIFKLAPESKGKKFASTIIGKTETELEAIRVAKKLWGLGITNQGWYDSVLSMASDRSADEFLGESYRVLEQKWSLAKRIAKRDAEYQLERLLAVLSAQLSIGDAEDWLMPEIEAQRRIVEKPELAFEHYYGVSGV